MRSRHLVSGIDEAGRGSVIGPLVIAGISLPIVRVKDLTKFGVKDSKLLAPKQRLKLAEKIEKVATAVSYKEISVAEIDRTVSKGRRGFKLNHLEARFMAKILDDLKPRVAYVDAVDVIAERFGRHIADMANFNVKVISEHKADRKYPIVSAASILAKVRRDNIIAKLRKSYGELGSGYPGDPTTIEFLRLWVKKYDAYPKFVRKSWKTSKRVKMEALTDNKLNRYLP